MVFAATAKMARKDAAESPDAWPTVVHWEPPLVRSRRIGSFSYCVVYNSRGDVVTVISCAHEASIRLLGTQGRLIVA